MLKELQIINNIDNLKILINKNTTLVQATNKQQFKLLNNKISLVIKQIFNPAGSLYEMLQFDLQREAAIRIDTEGRAVAAEEAGRLRRKIKHLESQQCSGREGDFCNIR